MAVGTVYAAQPRESDPERFVRTRMAHRDVVVIGASAGGIAALEDLFSRIPAKAPFSFFVVVHTSASSPGVLPALLSRAGPLPASFAQDREVPRRGHIYVARPDFHLLFLRQRMRVAHGPKENGFRPAADPLFRTAARNFGARAIGIVLSGGLDDGTDGLRTIKEHNGIAIAQHPEEAVFPSMPASAIRNVNVDHIARIAEIPAILEHYAAEVLPKEVTMPPDPARIDVTDHGDHGLQNKSMNGTPASLTCPECGGALWETVNGTQLRYQCHVGHIYTGDGLVSEMDRDLEQSLWAAVRVMEEAAALRRRMAGVAKDARWNTLAPRYARQAAEIERSAASIRRVLQNGSPKPSAGQAAEPEARQKKKSRRAARRRS